MSLEMSENLKEIDHLEDLGVDNLIIRQIWILNKIVDDLG